MITYAPGKWQVMFICRLNGSVLPRACAFALPAALCACVLHSFNVRKHDEAINVSNVVTTFYGAYTSVLGFLVVFRSQSAYTRYWEGASLLQRTRGQWFNATSSLVAFCSSDPDKKTKVEEFQHLVVRLVSIMHCTALQQISDIDEEKWTTLDRSGIDIPSMSYLASKCSKCEIIFQWIQRLIGENISNGVLCAAPPIMSRVFQDLSLGLLHANTAKKLNEVPFPFPYAQLVTILLLCFTITTPWFLSNYTQHRSMAAGLTFVTVGIFWCINYIAAEMENPFGSDANDLPVLEIQQRMNACLSDLLEEHAQIPPNFDLAKMKPVTRQSPVSWISDGVIVPPDDITNEECSSVWRWRQMLASRKAPVLFHDPYELASFWRPKWSLSEATPASVAATSEGAALVPIVLQEQLSAQAEPLSSQAAPQSRTQGSHAMSPFKYQTDRVGLPPQTHRASPSLLEAGFLLSTTRIADDLESLRQDVKMLVDSGNRLPSVWQSHNSSKASDPSSIDDLHNLKPSPESTFDSIHAQDVGLVGTGINVKV